MLHLSFGVNTQETAESGEASATGNGCSQEIFVPIRLGACLYEVMDDIPEQSIQYGVPIPAQTG